MTPDDERIKRERLGALLTAGYQPKSWNSTDIELYRQAQLLAGGAGRVLDHPQIFAHGDDRVIIFHTYHSADNLAEQVRAITNALSERWHCDIRAAFDERFNIYYPSWGCGYELRRHRSVRARRVW